jgi:hypothetical protein
MLCDLPPDFQYVTKVPSPAGLGSYRQVAFVQSDQFAVQARETAHQYLARFIAPADLSRSEQISLNQRSGFLPSPATVENWRKHVCQSFASTDIDALTETAEAVFDFMAEAGPAHLNLSNLTPDHVQGEHLAMLLRTSLTWREQIPGWQKALQVARLALEREGVDPEEALFGLI